MQIGTNIGRHPSHVFSIHGVVDSVNPNWLSHRNFLEKHRFTYHIKHRKSLYVSITAALDNKGDAITIDDATYAGYEAALIARAYGHEVSIFINPYNVINQSPYSFALLCLIIDRTKTIFARFLGEQFHLSDIKGRLALRQRVKQELLTLALEEERNDVIRNLAVALKVEDLSVPRYFQVLDIESLRKLKQLGVNIGNHGWTHSSITALTSGVAETEIKKAKNWIAANLATDANSYAVPFGMSMPTFKVKPKICTIWLLNDSMSPPGYVNESIFNRETLQI